MFIINKFIKIFLVFVSLLIITQNVPADTTMTQKDIERMLKEKPSESNALNNKENHKQRSDIKQDEITVTNLFSEEATYENFESHKHKDDMQKEFFKESYLEP